MNTLISFRMDWLDLLAVQGTLKSLLQHHSLKASILQLSAFCTVQLSHPCEDLIWAWYSILWVCMSIFMSVPHCFDSCQFTVSLEIRVLEFQWCVLFQSGFDYSLRLHMNFRMDLSIIGILTGIALNLCIFLSTIDILALLNLSTHEHGIHFYLCLSLYADFFSTVFSEI